MFNGTSPRGRVGKLGGVGDGLGVGVADGRGTGVDEGAGVGAAVTGDVGAGVGVVGVSTG